MSKGEEIAQVAAQLDALLDDLRVNVDALNEILTRPARPGGETDGRLVPQ